MDEESLLPFDLPTIARKRVSAAFDGGRITSDGGVMLLAQAERRLRIADRLAGVIPDGRDASRITHLLADILRARIFAIACGYEDADDLDRLRFDPALKLACGRLPDSGEMTDARTPSKKLPIARDAHIHAELIGGRGKRTPLLLPRRDFGGQHIGRRLSAMDEQDRHDDRAHAAPGFVAELRQ
jgi:Transposase DDE domain group 1